MLTTVKPRRKSGDGGLESNNDIALVERPSTANGQVVRPASAKSNRSSVSVKSKTSNEDGQSQKAWTSESEIYLRTRYLCAVLSTALSLLVMLSSYASPAWEKVYYNEEAVVASAGKDPEIQVSEPWAESYNASLSHCDTVSIIQTVLRWAIMQFLKVVFGKLASSLFLLFFHFAVTILVRIFCLETNFLRKFSCCSCLWHDLADDGLEGQSWLRKISEDSLWRMMWPKFVLALWFCFSVDR